MRRAIMTVLVLALVMTVGLAPQAAEKKVDLNQADLDQLISLPGIGPALARRILDYREKNGRFRKVEELLNIRGIGEKKFADLEDRVTVAPPAPPKPGKP